MQRQLKQVEEFHKAFQSHWEYAPKNVSDNIQNLRIALMKEELDEVVAALKGESLENIGKELADLLYVVYGTIGSYGLAERMEAIFDEVHRSNMSKFAPDGGILQREDGKALKGPDYSPANIKSVLDKR